MALSFEVLISPRNVRTPGANAIVGDGALFQRMVDAGWIRPVVNRPKCKLYRVADVNRCCDWLDEGYYPGEQNPSRVTAEALPTPDKDGRRPKRNCA